MEPNLDARQKIQFVLTKILDEYTLGSRDAREIVLRLDQFFVSAPVDRFEFLKVIENLRSEGVVSLFAIRKNHLVRHPHDDKQDYNICVVGIPVDFKTRAEEYLSEVSDSDLSPSPNILYLDETGNFWHGNKNKFCYPLGATGGRLKILKHLAENKGLQSTESMASALSKEEQNIRTEIAKMRQRIEHYLKLNDVILNKKDSGYEINSKYKVIIE